MSNRAQFGSRLGIILASAGSAVGLGNVWRFPTETGNNGGAAFLLIYVLCVLALGMPVMISEFLIGRHSHANTATAYEILSPGTKWKWVGRLGVFCGLIILSYYSVVAGWTLEYTVKAAANEFAGASDYGSVFNDFVSRPIQPLLSMTLFLLLTHYVIVRGVQKGIEKFSKIMMPLLLLIIVLLVGFSFTMPGAKAGLTFLLKPDFNKVTSDVVMSAMGQAFFSLSLGMGCLCTYASYFGEKVNLVKTATGVIVLDTVIAIMAGFIIFPAVFSVPGVSPNEGPGLVFITLPSVFNLAFGGAPVLAYIFSTLFYILLALSALTSTISMHEVVTAYIHERFGLERSKAAICVTGICFFYGLFCSLSFGVLNDARLFDMTIFDIFDYVSGKLLLPIGGMFISIFAGWFLDKKIRWEEVTNGGKVNNSVYNVYVFILKFICPVAIAIVFINELLGE
jgi:NSS family neurotransmitter:Na+ symporter